MNRLKTLVIALAAIAIVSGPVAAATHTTDDAGASVVKIISDKIEFLMSEGVSLEDAAGIVTRGLAKAVKFEKNPDVIKDIYAAVLRAAANSGIGTGSDSFSAAIALISAMMINTYGVPEEVVVESAIVAKINVATVIDTLPATAAGQETDPVSQASQIAKNAASTGIITSNTARSGGGAGSPSI